MSGASHRLPRGRSRAHNRTERRSVGQGRGVGSDRIAQAEVELALASMNKLETAFAAELKLRLRAAELEWWAFEPFRFRIGTGAHYTPDFAALDHEAHLTLYEVKGRWEEAARVRIKVAAHLYPMLRFVAVTRPPREGWQYEEIRP